MVFGIFSIAGAMLCLVQFFYQSSDILAPHQAVLKFLAIKLVVIVFYTEGVSAQNHRSNAYLLNSSSSFSINCSPMMGP